jgi:hypothetical protein
MEKKKKYSALFATKQVVTCAQSHGFSTRIRINNKFLESCGSLNRKHVTEIKNQSEPLFGNHTQTKKHLRKFSTLIRYPVRQN